MSQVRSLASVASEDIDEVVRHADWDALRGARVLVTGATGWFGTWLLDSIVAASRARSLGISVIAMSRDPRTFASRHPALAAAEEITWVSGDVSSWPASVPNGVSHVIHAATDSGSQLAREPATMFDTVVLGTRSALRFAAEQRCEGVLVVSSGAVYGKQPESLDAVPEDFAGGPDPTSPQAVYAEGKRAAEQLATAWSEQYGVRAKIARCFAFVGPHMPLGAHFAIGNFIADAIAGRSIVVKGDGRAVRSYLYMTDLVSWLLAVLVRGETRRAYNVGSPIALSIGELARKVASVVGSDAGVEILGAPGGRVDRYVPDSGRIGKELGVKESVGLGEAIRRTAEWARRG